MFIPLSGVGNVLEWPRQVRELILDSDSEIIDFHKIIDFYKRSSPTEKVANENRREVILFPAV